MAAHLLNQHCPHYYCSTERPSQPARLHFNRLWVTSVAAATVVAACSIAASVSSQSTSTNMWTASSAISAVQPATASMPASHPTSPVQTYTMAPAIAPSLPIPKANTMLSALPNNSEQQIDNRLPIILSGAITFLGVLGVWWRNRQLRTPALPMSIAAMTGKYAVLPEETMMQDTLTEKIARNLKDRYGDVEMKRVVKAWRRMEAGVVHTETHGPGLMVQRCNLFIEGLSANPRPVWENADIAWASVLENGWEAIRKELDQVIQLGDEGLAARKSEGWVSPISMGASEAYGPNWKILNIMERGKWDDVAMQLFPETCRILRESEAPIMEAEFALLPARSEIKPHSDGWNFMLTAHLPLIVPKNSTAYTLNVGDSQTKWKEGELLLFDSSFMHEAKNNTEEDRYVLLLRLWHPELTTVEQQALEYLFEVMEERSPRGGKSLRDKPAPEEPYTVEIGDDVWKLPGGCNTFDTRIFGPNMVLYDIEEAQYTACQGGTRFYIEKGHRYEVRLLVEPEVESIPRNRFGEPDPAEEEEPEITFKP